MLLQYLEFLHLDSARAAFAEKWLQINITNDSIRFVQDICWELYEDFEVSIHRDSDNAPDVIHMRKNGRRWMRYYPINRYKRFVERQRSQTHDTTSSSSLSQESVTSSSTNTTSIAVAAPAATPRTISLDSPLPFKVPPAHRSFLTNDTQHTISEYTPSESSGDEFEGFDEHDLLPHDAVYERNITVQHIEDTVVDVPLKHAKSYSKEMRVLRFILKKILQWFPIIGMIMDYRKDFFKKFLGDVIAGVSVSLLLIPQAMSYALLAGLPVEYGIYTSLAPQIVYIILGTSKQAKIGPVGLASMLTSEYLADVNEEDRLDRVFLLTLVTGLLMLVFGVLNLGFLTDFLSHSVMAGFVAGTAVVVIASQFKYILGSEQGFTKDKRLHYIIQNYTEVREVHWQSIVFGLVCIMILFFFRYFWFKLPTGKNRTWKAYSLRRLPAPAAVVVISIVVTYLIAVATDNNEPGVTRVAGIGIVGEVNGGVPTPSLGSGAFSIGGFDEFLRLLASAASIAFIGFLESISVAKYYALKEHDNIDPNQELRALGFASLIGSFFSSYPAFGSFSRSGLSEASGGKTQMSSVITVLVVLLVAFFLTPLFFYLPLPMLAALIIVSVLFLIDIKEFIHIARVKKGDAIAYLVAFTFVMFAGIDIGVALAIFVSLALIIVHISRPKIMELGLMPGTVGEYRNTNHWIHASTTPGILMCRVDSSIYFPSVNYLRNKVLRKIRKNPYKIYVFILDMESVNRIDVAGCEILLQLYSFLKNQGILLFISHLKSVLSVPIKRAGVKKIIPEKNFFRTNYMAMEEAKGYLHNKVIEEQQSQVEVRTVYTTTDLDPIIDRAERQGRTPDVVEDLRSFVPVVHPPLRARSVCSTCGGAVSALSHTPRSGSITPRSASSFKGNAPETDEYIEYEDPESRTARCTKDLSGDRYTGHRHPTQREVTLDATHPLPESLDVRDMQPDIPLDQAVEDDPVDLKHVPRRDSSPVHSSGSPGAPGKFFSGDTRSIFGSPNRSNNPTPPADNELNEHSPSDD